MAFGIVTYVGYRGGVHVIRLAGVGVLRVPSHQRDQPYDVVNLDFNFSLQEDVDTSVELHLASCSWRSSSGLASSLLL